ncbi:hypothetical protein C4559_04935 [Candidatus Microgenomates bacterium]|nr:MAG: hypothetical protein C4559_04935 [Candidatus Microgenomates bacterium]
MLTKSDISQIQKVVEKSIKKETDPIKKDVKSIKNSLHKVKKTVDTMAFLFDSEDVRLRKGVEKIEEQLSPVSS